MVQDHSGFNALGDVTFTGSGAGLPFGHMGQENIPTTVTINTAGTAEIVDGMTGGNTNNVTFQDSQELKVLKAGKYSVYWAVSFSLASGNNKECEGRIGINGTAQAEGSAHRKIGASNDVGSMCGVAILDLSVDDLITIMVENGTDTTDLVIAHASLSLTQVGN